MSAPSILGEKKTIGVPRGLPNIPQHLPPDVRTPLERMKHAIEELQGTIPSEGNAAFTLRTVGGLPGIGGTGTFPGGTAADSEPDLTPPPTVAGLAAIAGLTNVIVSFDPPVYTQGHGNLRTNLYASKKLASDATLPTFADAVLVDQASGSNFIRALPSDLGVRWHIWAKHETVDGVLSPSPAGGVNGVVAQTGLIGGSDLGPLIIQAGNIAAKAIDASKMTVEDFSTIADNPTFEAGDVGWHKESGWSIVNEPANAFMGSWCAKHVGGAPAALRSLPVIPCVQGDEFYAEVMVKADGANSSGTGIRFTGFSAAGAEVWQPAGAPFITGTTGYTRSSISATVPGGLGIVGIRAEIVALHTVGTTYVDNVRFQRKLTLNHLAAGSIAVGSAAIANGAIVNFMLGTGSIDDAKVADLSAAKLTAGDGTIGGILKSGNYVPGTTGWMVSPLGSVEFSNATIRGSTFTGSINAGAGSIGGILIAANAVYSSNYVPGVGGFRLNADGSAEFRNIIARGDIVATAVTVAAMDAAINGGGAPSSRVAISSNKIEVWNAGVRRVLIGNLA